MPGFAKARGKEEWKCASFLRQTDAGSIGVVFDDSSPAAGKFGSFRYAIYPSVHGKRIREARDAQFDTSLCKSLRALLTKGISRNIDHVI